MGHDRALGARWQGALSGRHFPQARFDLLQGSLRRRQPTQGHNRIGGGATPAQYLPPAGSSAAAAAGCCAPCCLPSPPDAVVGELWGGAGEPW